MFVTVEQIKAARALLRWTQKDLARHAGLNESQIQAFEAKRTHSLEVLEAICKAFALQGLDFSDGGVVPSKVSSYALDSYLDVLHDISASMPGGGEILRYCADDGWSLEMTHEIRQMREGGIKERLIVSEENRAMSGSNIRKIPAAYFFSTEIIVYLNKVAFFVDGKALVVINQTLADIFRCQFESWWKSGKPLEEHSTG